MKHGRFVAAVCGLLLFCMLCTGLSFCYRYKMMHQIIGYQPNRIMVDEILYMNFGETQQEKPTGEPDGLITEIIGSASFPKENGQANFGSAGMPYWYVEDKIVVAYEQYYLFKQA